tara:strand:- start:162561 stop:162692 length:132 start_codon:yes stop_codon:yes gene_type:complete
MRRRQSPEWYCNQVGNIQYSEQSAASRGAVLQPELADPDDSVI